MKHYTRITISPEERMCLEVVVEYLIKNSPFPIAARVLTNLLERSKHKEIVVETKEKIFKTVTKGGVEYVVNKRGTTICPNCLGVDGCMCDLLPKKEIKEDGK